MDKRNHLHQNSANNSNQPSLLSLLLSLFYKGLPLSFNILPGSNGQAKFFLMLWRRNETGLNLHDVITADSHQELRDKLVLRWHEWDIGE